MRAPDGLLPAPWLGSGVRSILMIEDDGAIRRGLSGACTHAGYRVTAAIDGDEGIAYGVRGEHDLVLLDLLLPRQDGRAVLKAIRSARPTVPVIVLTAFASEDDRVALLSLGADDYVTKPFSVRELLARINAVLRRSSSRPADVDDIDFAQGTIDLSRSQVCFHDGTSAMLGTRENDLLRYLASNAGRVVSRTELLENVWRLDAKGLTGPGGTRVIDMHIARLREKLRDDAESPSVVVTVRGKGYMFARST
jgi:two-component system alkaline phosphatase synthesis response regulator PhoP